ncbi:hypothetical protein Brms1b_002729 [Colletotrichum noveboracense]|nr:hypothetical protein Brms1b_002729 [Colletotrichum noveboracense]
MALRDALQKDIISPPKLDEEESLNAELGQGRLHELVDRLWIAGKPTPPNALHFQRVLGRDIIVVESMDLHLVCSHTQFYAKPIPPFLLEPSFWTRHLSCGDGCDCSDNPSNSCSRRTLWKSALGFLYSYRALIRHESDFHLAQDNYLLPDQIDWADWKRFVAELNTKHPDGQIHERFMYGELRRGRLNKLLSIRSNFRESTYVPRWYRHGEFFRDNFAWLASPLVYIAIVLTAMQLGLATKALEENALFHSASYGFTVFAIVGPLAAAGMIIARYVCRTAVHMISADRAYRKILRDGEKSSCSHSQHC